MKKSHPVRRIVLAGAATVSGVVLLVTLKPTTGPASAAAPSPDTSQAPGTLTGATVQTRYGPVQVRITVANGKITKADAIQAPHGGLNSKKTAMAVPRLDQEAVAAGNAHIDTVTGATYTSNGYKQSLQSALDQQKPATTTTRTVTGAVTQTQYGPVQVRITLTNGKITKADAIQAPHGGLNSKKTAMAVPRLDQEAVAAGNAHIDTVTGATYTSNGYKQSLQSALDQQKPATTTTRTVTGAVTQTQYGPVQVRITLTNGKITKADAIQAPHGGLDSEKTAMAVPRLDQEAVAAGSARIDTVSGATYTSGGYKQSLQSALDQVHG
ncbi:FMN-binding protein [Streptomyces sp. MB22_4]|uniref:FMN-binding protein n=1 Tax=Streptomyces sp. MB22_4 TaxID=3383120 RepID=UPI00399F51DC